jgi:hypothetical protein
MEQEGIARVKMFMVITVAYLVFWGPLFLVTLFSWADYKTETPSTRDEIHQLLSTIRKFGIVVLLPASTMPYVVIVTTHSKIGE